MNKQTFLIPETYLQHWFSPVSDIQRALRGAREDDRRSRHTSPIV